MSARVATATFAPIFGDLDANVQLSTQAIRQALARQADIIILPELCLSGYMFETREEVDAIAITQNDAGLSLWSAELEGSRSLVIGSFAEKMTDGTFCISAAVVGAAGVVAIYRKSHLWNREKRFFTPGNEAPPIVETPWGNVGVLICYDLEFPELTRSLAMRGADLLAVPTNWSGDLSGPGSEPGQIVVARATARLNHIYVACTDRVGIERGQAFACGSALIDTQGEVVVRQQEAGIAVCEFDLLEARDRHSSTVNHVFGDRRPELYI